MDYSTKPRTARTRVLSVEDEPAEVFAYLNIDVTVDDKGHYRLEAVGLSRQRAMAAAKYILGSN